MQWACNYRPTGLVPEKIVVDESNSISITVQITEAVRCLLYFTSADPLFCHNSQAPKAQKNLEITQTYDLTRNRRKFQRFYSLMEPNGSDSRNSSSSSETEEGQARRNKWEDYFKTFFGQNKFKANV